MRQQTIVAQARSRYAAATHKTNEGNTPEKKFRAGSISATVWLNSSRDVKGQETQYRTISIERSYTDKDGKWHSTNSMRLNDLPKAKLVLDKAYEYLIYKEQDLGESA